MTFHQTQAQQEELRADFANLVSCTRWDIHRCTHITNDRAALWVMNDNKQIGSVTWTGEKWTVQKLVGGSPVSNRSFSTLLEAAAHSVSSF